MKNRSVILITFTATLCLIIASCAPASAPAFIEESGMQATIYEESVEKEIEAPVMEMPAEGEADLLQATAMPTMAGEVQTSSNVPLTSAKQPNRLIIKNAEVNLLVEDTDIAIDRVTQLVEDVRGYIISNRIWYQDEGQSGYKYAAITIGVPVDEFEFALRRLRGIALRVQNETASGQDVTDEYVDLESRLTNLKATRDRIREFLEQANTVEEALKVNEQLSSVEAEIEQVQGRMNYLFDRASYSTITVYLEPEILPLTPTPTFTPTPTPTPKPWNPGKTFDTAFSTLGSITRGLIDALIWIMIIFVPLFVLPVAALWWLVRLLRGKGSMKENKAPKETKSEEDKK